MYRTHIPIFGRQFVAEWCKPTWGQKKSITKTAEYNGKAPQNSYIVLRSLDGARPWHAKWKAPVVSSAGAELTAARAATSFANKCCFSCVSSVFLYMLHSEPQRSTLSWPTHTPSKICSKRTLHLKFLDRTVQGSPNSAPPGRKCFLWGMWDPRWTRLVCDHWGLDLGTSNVE